MKKVNQIKEIMKIEETLANIKRVQFKLQHGLDAYLPHDLH